jgi:hypothetical protein
LSQGDEDDILGRGPEPAPPLENEHTGLDVGARIDAHCRGPGFVVRQVEVLGGERRLPIDLQVVDDLEAPIELLPHLGCAGDRRGDRQGIAAAVGIGAEVIEIETHGVPCSKKFRTAIAGPRPNVSLSQRSN